MSVAQPFSLACERNRGPILAVLERVLADRQHVLEIGSGTGQHAVYFGAALPHLIWQTSDLLAMHAGVNTWIAVAALPNVRAPLVLDLEVLPWQLEGIAPIDAIFAANVVHIVAERQVENLLRGAADVLAPGGLMCLYGPFNYGGCFTSDSNRAFDAWLKARDPRSGVRDFESLARLAGEIGLSLLRDVEMPANNRMLLWRRP